MSDATVTPSSIHDSKILPAIAETVPEPTQAELKATIAQLEAEIAANKLRGKQEKILNDDGTIKTVAHSILEAKAATEELYLVTERARRARLESEAQNPIPYRTESGGLEYRSQFSQDKPLFPTPDDAERLLGRTRFAAMSPKERAAVRDIRASDVARLDPAVYFGKGSSSLKASELGKTSPGLYAALKQRAVKEGIF
ncbi:hypothetical protein P8936_11660 [Edaphobacter paludis]|uniref:Uncharacterized protein n=1 Tax=Edaphobacter paludis TaxID=3035702 RepID=A0AAU7D3N3_9BACT